MKRLKIAAALITLAGIGSPAVAQNGYDGLQFVQAVRKSDADEAIKLLGSQGSGILDTKDDDGNTPLIITISRSDDEWTAFLLNKGADPNFPGKGGDTPLIAAARVGYEQAAEWLLGLGAKTDAANKMGETALIVAVQQHQVPLVKLLLAAGADPDKADSAAGLSARDYAARDTRSRDILNLITAKKPKPAATVSR